MRFVFDAYIILFLFMPFIVLLWLIRPSYFPFQKDIDTPISRKKILGLSVLVFIISLVLVALIVPESVIDSENTSALGLLTGFLLSILAIYLSVKKGKSFKKTHNQKVSFNQNSLLRDQSPENILLNTKENKTADSVEIIKSKQMVSSDAIESNKKRSFFEQRKVKSDIYKRLIEIGSDGKLTIEEEQEVRDLLLDANLTKKQELKGFVKAYKKAYEHVVSDDIVTQREHESLDRIRNLFNIPSEMISKELSILEKHKVLRDMQDGNLPKCKTNIILNKDEVSHFSYFGDLIEERTVKGSYQGGSAGVSFRVAKGVNFRVGQSRGSYQSERKPVTVSSGKLIITNKRIIFDGDKKNFNINITQLLGYEVLDDSVLIKPNRGKPKLVMLKDKSYDPDILDMGLNLVVYS